MTAACVGMADLFFDEARFAKAKEVCAKCVKLVDGSCREEAMLPTPTVSKGGNEISVEDPLVPWRHSPSVIAGFAPGEGPRPRFRPGVTGVKLHVQGTCQHAGCDATFLQTRNRKWCDDHRRPAQRGESVPGKNPPRLCRNCRVQLPAWTKGGRPYALDRFCSACRIAAEVAAGAIVPA